MEKNEWHWVEHYCGDILLSRRFVCGPLTMTRAAHVFSAMQMRDKMAASSGPAIPAGATLDTRRETLIDRPR